jgi:hypothetical protein
MNHSHSNPEQRNRERERVNSEGSLQQQNEINSVEELIQLDYSNTELPESIKHRLLETVPKESQERQSWWRRLFGKTPTDLE